VRVLDSEQPYFEGITALIKEKVLSCRDVAVYYGVVERTNWRTGICEYTLAALADELGLSRKYVVNSVARLKRAKALINQVDGFSGRRYILVNPTFSWSGGEARKTNAWKAWIAALKQDSPEEVAESVLDYEDQAKIDAHNRRMDAVARWNQRNAS